MESNAKIVNRLFLGFLLRPHFDEFLDSFVKRVHHRYPHERWTDLEHLHITVHFFGHVDGAEEQRLDEAVSGAVAELEPLSFSLEGIGFFPGLSKAKIAWIGTAAEDYATLSAFYARIATALRNAGFATEKRPYKPHATLFRIQNGEKFFWDFRKYPFEKTEKRSLSELTLFESLPSDKGTRYRVRKRYFIGNQV